MADPYARPVERPRLILRELPEGKLWIVLHSGDTATEDDIKRWCSWAAPVLEESKLEEPLVVSVSQIRALGPEAFAFPKKR